MGLHLEYPVQFCSTDAKKDIFELGKVQEKVTRMIKGVDQLPHQKSLNRIDWKWNNGVGVGQRSINHTRVSRGEQTGHNGSTVPSGQEPGHSVNRGGSRWKTKERQRLSSQRVIKLWSTLPQDAADTSSFKRKTDKFTEQRFAGDCCILEMWLPAQGRLSPKLLAGEHSKQVLFTKPCSYFTQPSMAPQHQREDPRLDGSLVWPALPFLRSYFLSVMLKTTSSDRFLLASKPSHIQVTCQPFTCETSLLPAPCLQHFSPSSLPEKRTFLDINLLWSDLRNIPAIYKETQLY